MSSAKARIGLDVGSSFVKFIARAADGELIAAQHLAHHGEPAATAAELLTSLPIDEFFFGLTGSHDEALAASLEATPVLTVEAAIRAARRAFPAVRNIIAVGASTAALVKLTAGGEFLSLASNSQCAAGAGAFLDEQARRLGLSYETIANSELVEDPPSIASRCAVFAKSDLIHRQQEGCTVAAMWSGLCKGCVDTILQTLLKGQPLTGPTVFVGGVARNPQVVAWLHRRLGAPLHTWPLGHLAAALGAADLAATAVRRGDLLARLHRAAGTRGKQTVLRGALLNLEKSRYPSFVAAASWIDELGNEITLHDAAPVGELPAFIGVDVGSTSTKMVATDEAGRVRLDVYRKTDGDPIGAVKKLFTAVERLGAERGLSLRPLGCGVTGSGRKFIGKIIGADAIVNEISAHVAGAAAIDPQVETIFEIGGQDAKYMRVVDGGVRDANLNFICAAGTGSFVEETAARLGFALPEIGPAVLGVAPPQTSDRCTVFMQEDVNHLLRQGFTPLDAMAATLNSVVKNYLTKVVGNRPISRQRIVFQGATARNQGLVAAFEQQLGTEIVVSPLCHQMGAYGVALLTQRAMAERGTASTFRGFGLARRSIAVDVKACALCNNHCKLSFAAIEGEAERPSWGYLCGREPDAAKRRANPHFDLFRTRAKLLRKRFANQPAPADAPVVALPASLTTHSHLPFWTALLNGLDRRVALSPPTDDAIKRLAERAASGDFCFPMKTALGHALHLAERGQFDWLLLPQMISATPNEHTTNAWFCPYVQSYAGVSRSLMEVNGLATARLLTPVIDLRWSETLLLKELTRSLAGPLGASAAMLQHALRAALEAQREFEDGCRAAGRRALAELRARGERGVVILGRPYNVFDPGVNVALPEKLSEYGVTVIPVDCLPFDPAELGENYRNIYWNYGQRLLAAAQTIARRADLHAVYLSNFNCGPDSFLLTYAERLMGDKPMLVLELDAHGADAGYLTRVEAFLDVIARPRQPASARPIRVPPARLDDLKRRTLWLPPMHPLAGPLAKAVFDRFGYRAEALPPEDRAAYELGRKAVRGSECLPAHVTIGGLLKRLRELDARPEEHAFFMATAEGPCRFGQYALLHRLILDQQGYEGLPILSPSSFNSYQGLDERVRRPLWQAFLTADVLFKAACRVRPYEHRAGQTDQALAEQTEALAAALRRGDDLERPIRRAMKALAAVPRTAEEKPLVGIVGEIYVRCNPFSNGCVIDHIERYGGEAWLAPMAEWFLYTAHIQAWKAKEEMAGLTARGKSLLKNRYLSHAEHQFYDWCSPLLDQRREPSMSEILAAGQRFLPLNFEGEAVLTVGRAVRFVEQGAALVVNAAPFGCMPGTLTAALLGQVQQERQAPIVSQYYDGEDGLNRRLAIYLKEAAERANGREAAAKRA